MAKSVLSAPRFHNEEIAFEYVEAQLWPDGPVCPHCGAHGDVGRLKGRTSRPGLRKCYRCRKAFTVRIGTIFEDSHLPLHLWLQAIHLMSASKKGISTRQLQRMLSCGMKTAWHLGHRIRAAMDDGTLSPMGGSGGIVEVDETFIGRLEGVPKQRTGSAHKNVVLTLVERGGAARSFHVESTRRTDVEGVMRANIRKGSRLMTDEARHYKAIGREFASHESVNLGEGEYGRGEVHTNTVEGFYSVFKRGMIGVYQHCSERHLHRYLSEFDFRYSNRVRLGIDDVARADRTLRGTKGKRLTYRTAHHVEA